eukprot:scaffold2008_cov283-Pinguiococcus_pyrenoidosus.AAC.4
MHCETKSGAKEGGERPARAKLRGKAAMRCACGRIAEHVRLCGHVTDAADFRAPTYALAGYHR